MRQILIDTFRFEYTPDLDRLAEAVHQRLFSQQNSTDHLQFAQNAYVAAELPIVTSENAMRSVHLVPQYNQENTLRSCYIKIPATVWRAEGGFKEVTLGFCVQRNANSLKSSFCAICKALPSSENLSEDKLRKLRINEYRLQRKAYQLGCALRILTYTQDCSEVFVEFCPYGPLSTCIDIPLRKTAQHLIRQLAALHKAGIYHQDIKPGNILCQSLEVRFSDFGNAVDEKSDPFMMSIFGGTPKYYSPPKQNIYLARRFCRYILRQRDSISREYEEDLKTLLPHGQAVFGTQSEPFNKWAVQTDHEAICGAMGKVFNKAYEMWKETCESWMDAQARRDADVWALGLSLSNLQTRQNIGFRPPADCPTQPAGPIIGVLTAQINQIYAIEPAYGSLKWVIWQMLCKPQTPLEDFSKHLENDTLLT